MVGSPPPCLAAMMMARLSLLQSLPRLASMAPFLCLIVAQWEWPDMVPPSRWSRPYRSDVARCELFKFLLQRPIALVHFTPFALPVKVQRLPPRLGRPLRLAQRPVHVA